MNKLRRENEASGTRVVYLVDCVVCWTGLKPYYKGTSTIGLNYLARSFFHCDCIVETFVLRLIGRSLSLSFVAFYLKKFESILDHAASGRSKRLAGQTAMVETDETNDREIPISRLCNKTLPGSWIAMVRLVEIFLVLYHHQRSSRYMVCLHQKDRNALFMGVSFRVGRRRDVCP